MNEERWRMAKEIYQSLVGQEPSQRDAYLTEACAGDELLRKDVESLIACRYEAEDLMASPAMEAVASELARDPEADLCGRMVLHYQVKEKIGAGGMGVVYRATDMRLHREVAMKALPAVFASDPERLTRFEREARLLATLSHPNVAAIHGLEEWEGKRFIVMELAGGETLAARIAKGPVPLEESMKIALQIAEALENAHEKGIIHRDLKPANIKITAEGKVKLLDFGLAKAFQGEMSAVDAMKSPTLTDPMTRPGLILGTAAYMAPEQAQGKSVDKRADIWAFGCILYECLTGRRAFGGDAVTETLAAVLKDAPDWIALPNNTPPGLHRLLRRCLQKDPRQRLNAIGDARLEIDDAQITPPEAKSNIGQSGSAPPPARLQPLPWVLAGLLAAILAVVAAVWAPWRKPLSPAPMHLSVKLGANLTLAGQLSYVASSPDGAVIAFVAREAAAPRPKLYVQPLYQDHATPLPGTDGAYYPFFSPDGQWIAFFAGGKLKKISASGGSAEVTLCDAPDARGATWAEDGTITFTPDIRQGTVLMRVGSDGGIPKPLTTRADGEITQRWPQILPGGRAVLFTSNNVIGDFDAASLVVQPLPSGARKVVLRGGYHGRYVPSGHLVYMHEGALFAAPFDLERREVTGQAVLVLKGVRSMMDSGYAEFALSETGLLLYRPGPSIGGSAPIHWLNREGQTKLLRSTPLNWSDLEFAADGRRLAIEIVDRQRNIWIYEWERDALSRLTSSSANDTNPVWSPDGRRLAFASTRGDRSTPNLYWQSPDGTDEAHRLTESFNQQLPFSWHPNGKFLAFEEVDPKTKSDVMILPLVEDGAAGLKPGKPIVFLNTPSSERAPVFSPDGRWLAYVSDESGGDEVYVRPFPGPGGKIPISTSGGNFPTWSRAKRELFYGTGTEIMLVPFTVEGDTFHAGKPQLWSERRYSSRGAQERMFDLHPDGERFALRLIQPQGPGGATPDHVSFIINFFEELKRLFAAGNK